MIRLRHRLSRDPVRVAAYLGLCVIMVAVGWTVVTTVAPVAEAGRSPAPTVAATPRFTVRVDPTPTVIPTPDPSAAASVVPTPDATPTKAPLQLDLYRPGTFVTQMNRDYCMAGAIQNMLNVIGPGVDLTVARQKQIGDVLVSLTTRQDSLNGGFGAEGWALTMTKLGGGNYQLVIDATFDQAMRDAALAISRTSRPAGLLTWWGAHSWVMTGFKADADPALFPTSFKLSGAYIMDPFYPRISDIWGQTLGPDTLRDMTAMAKNYIGWKRPEGRYPDRDGKWLLVIPVD
jgi:hypothetical protein